MEEKDSKFTKNWHKIFNETEHSLCISNSKAPHETARNVFKDDREEIEQAAKDNGFKCLGIGKSVSFAR
jgi:galactokinase